MKNSQTSVLQERLAKAAAYLEHLEKERVAQEDRTLGKAIEKRIIWRELFDLELQEFDEQIERLRNVTEDLIANAGAGTVGAGRPEGE